MATATITDRMETRDLHRYVWNIAADGALTLPTRDATGILDCAQDEGDRLWNLYYHFHDGVASGAWDSTVVTISGSHDNSNWVALATVSADNDPGEYIKNIRYRYIKVAIASGGASTILQGCLTLERS